MIEHIPLNINYENKNENYFSEKRKQNVPRDHLPLMSTGDLYFFIWKMHLDLNNSD